jgi:hypothetical protein
MNQMHGQPTTVSGHHHAARGFSSTFGLHPAVAALTLAVDVMVGAAEIATLGASWLFSLLVSAAVGYLSYRAQMKFFGDDSEAAQVKAGMLALLLAIPSPIPAFLYLPAGVIGFFQRNKN